MQRPPWIELAKKAPDVFWRTHQRLLEDLAKGRRSAGQFLRRIRPELVKDTGTIRINHRSEQTMTYAIVGFGAVGQALATRFARKGIEVSVASRRAPESLAPRAEAIGPTIVPKALEDALEADIILLAVPFWQHREVAKARANWQGKTVIDVTNAYGVPVDDLGGLPSSVVVANALPGVRLVKAFNHLAAATLAADPAGRDVRRVIFVSSDDEAAAAPVRALAEQLGFAPVWLGKLAEGGALVQARDKSWAPLIFQDLFKKEGSVIDGR
jgi:8-hydroxy-5-deazaflavin:NADPH oxidoreductase